MTIHYRGRLRDVDMIADLVTEVSSLAETLGWTFQTIHDETLRGIVLEVHDDCDPVILLVDRDGTLRSPFEELDELSLQLFVKTQYAPAEVHLAIVRLFRHVKKRYFAEFTVHDDSGYWETGERHEFVKHHPCVSVLTDRVAAAPSDATPPDDPVSGDLVERLEKALGDLGQDEPGPDYDEPFKRKLFDGPFEDEDRAFPQPMPPEDDVLVTWDVDAWIDYFEKHDRSRNTFLGFMSGREETEEEFSVALRESDEADARWERRTERVIRRLEREVIELRRQREAGEDDSDTAGGVGAEVEGFENEPLEPWKTSLPRFAPESRDHAAVSRATVYDCAVDDWAAIAAECPAVDAALELMRKLARRARERENENRNENRNENDSPMLVFVHGSISTTIIGASMGYYHWSRSEGYPLARTARYIIASRRFAQVARLLERMEEPELREMAPLARTIASGFASAAEESPGGRLWDR